jgi:hypothetical protein
MMRQGMQQDFKLQEIRTHGCYFLSLCRIAELLREEHGLPGFSDDDIIGFYKHGLAQRWITTGARDFNGRQQHVTCFIENGVAILNHLQDHMVFRTKSHERNLPNAKYYVVFFDDGNPLTHFAVGSGDKVIWDSWAPPALERGRRLATANPYRWFR